MINIIHNGQRFLKKAVSELKNGILQFSATVDENSYFRVEIENWYDMIALTNPIYIEIK